jgi:hypothetical protein
MIKLKIRNFLLFSGFLIDCGQLPVKLMVIFRDPEDIKSLKNGEEPQKIEKTQD